VDGSAFAETRYAIDPSPWPFPPPVMAIQLASLAAVHVHSRETLTETVPAPPDAPKLPVEFAMDG